MKFKGGTFGCAFLSCLSTMILTSCVYDNFSQEKEKDRFSVHDEMPVVMININSLTRSNSDNSGVKEMISYLRIIMLNEDTIEFNKFIPSFATDFGGTYNGGLETDGFEYHLIYPTLPGEKSFFVIGNEQMVKSVNFDWPEDFTPPQEVANASTLSDILNYYTTDENGAYPDKPGEFLTVMNSVYFTPDLDYLSTTDPSRVYLPYSAYYEGFTVYDEKENNKFDADGNIPYEMYLVPAATKVFVEFINNRKNPVRVNAIQLGGIAPVEFVNAQLDETELTRNDMWWIDWLEKIAKESQSYPDEVQNNEFNNLNGWIDLFDVPKEAYADEETGSGSEGGSGDAGDESGDPSDTPETPEEETIKGWVTVLDNNFNLVVPQYTMAEGPGNKKVGPFYLPESNYRVIRDVFDNLGNIITKEVQEYYITLDIEKDPESGNKPKFENVVIGNLKSFFRNTNLHIIIEMRDWDDNGAFAEIYPWNERQMNGFIVEEEYAQ